jgi:hypothetical protein
MYDTTASARIWRGVEAAMSGLNDQPSSSTTERFT